jgi:predicted PurR-regulated permease PerM
MKPRRTLLVRVSSPSSASSSLCSTRKRLIWLPASLYLFFTGDWGWGLFLAGWGVLVVGSIDNVLRPILMQGSSNMSTLLIFLALLGGIQLFGLIGVIYGPIIFALTLVLLRLYTIEFKDFLAQQDKS